MPLLGGAAYASTLSTDYTGNLFPNAISLYGRLPGACASKLGRPLISSSTKERSLGKTLKSPASTSRPFPFKTRA